MSELIEAKPLILIYEANDSQYKVIKAETIDGEDISLVGYFPNLMFNIFYEFEGEKVKHSKFGDQFKVKNYRRLDIDNRQGIIEYLIGNIRGVGIKTAEKIYDSFGPTALEMILNDKNILKSIGISESRIELIYEDILKNLSAEKIFIELYSYGLTPIMANKIYSTYNENTLEMIKKNPYRLIYEVEGFGFIKSDKLALSLGYSYHDKIRLDEGILYTISEICNSYGYCFLTEEQLINSALKLLNKELVDNLITEDEINYCLKSLTEKGRLILEDNRYYPNDLYDAEVEFAKKINTINKQSNKIYDLEYLADKIKDVELTLSIDYNFKQREAIINAINNNLSIITGGPGTGKTTIIKGVLNILASIEKLTLNDDKFRHRILLIAPTGRAAKRLGVSCGINAMTIHKALGYNYEDKFTYDDENPLKEDIIIIDEFSMVDIILANNLFKAIKDNSRIIIVGDSNQLPSISSGNVLHDLIESNIVKVTALTDIMRQQADSNIIKLSQMVINRNINASIFNERKELYFYPADIKVSVDRILQFVGAFIEKGGNILTDLQILIPMYSGPCGINEINRQIQAKFNQSTDMIVRGERIFKKLDKVLQLQNNPELQIMNGDIGYIKEIIRSDDGDILKIDFDGLLVSYPASELENLALAYAISIHKSQGSEYENVIMPINRTYYGMLKRNLIYTAITRAKSKLIIIGDINSLEEATHRNEDIRQTTLIQRLTNKNYNVKKIIYINDPEIPFDTLGEEGMEDITPYSFM